MITELLLEGFSLQALTGVSPVRARPTEARPSTESVEPENRSPAYKLELSKEGLQKSHESRENSQNSQDFSSNKDAEEAKELNKSKTEQGDSKQINELSEDEKAQVKELKDRDRAVRAHEAAHIAAAGGYARGGASYSYDQGPDGKRYAVGGEVNIDVSPEKDPVATLQKAAVIKGAALAPAEPSGQDRSVAAQATQMAAQARKELAEEKANQSTQSKPNSPETEPQANTVNDGVKIPKAYAQAQQNPVFSANMARSWVA